MFEKIRIQNFKSVYDETLELGRVNVFIGENGSGKSNLLEAIAFASAAANSREFNNDILFSKGVRVAMSSLMISSFLEKKQNKVISIELFDKVLGGVLFNLKAANDDYFPNWEGKVREIEYAKSVLEMNKKELAENFVKSFENDKSLMGTNGSNGSKKENLTEIFNNHVEKELGNFLAAFLSKVSNLPNLEDFLIYTANTTFLRGIHTESRKEPLGINGEGLDVLLASFDKEEIEKLKRYNYLIGWLEDFFMDIDDGLKLRGYKLNRSKSVLYFKDRFMMRKNNVFSAENSNEGILHILFYLALMISKRTPKFFAIDNIESSLNPHLCREIMTIICDLAKEEGSEKQLLITTHNPAILDGLNLNDDDIRLFEVYRNNNGHTKTRRIKLNADNKPEQLKLSELWTRGYLGATPKNF